MASKDFNKLSVPNMKAVEKANMIDDLTKQVEKSNMRNAIKKRDGVKSTADYMKIVNQHHKNEQQREKKFMEGFNFLRKETDEDKKKKEAEKKRKLITKCSRYYSTFLIKHQSLKGIPKPKQNDPLDVWENYLREMMDEVAAKDAYPTAMFYWDVLVDCIGFLARARPELFVNPLTRQPIQLSNIYGLQTQEFKNKAETEFQEIIILHMEWFTASPYKRLAGMAMSQIMMGEFQPEMMQQPPAQPPAAQQPFPDQNQNQNQNQNLNNADL